MITPFLCSNRAYSKLWLYLVDAITSGIHKLGAAVEVMQLRILPRQLLHEHPVMSALGWIQSEEMQIVL